MIIPRTLPESAEERKRLFWSLYASREANASLIFVRRMHRITLVHSWSSYYFSEGSYLICLWNTREPSFRSRPSNLLPDYQKQRVDPRCRFAEQAVYYRRQRRFWLETIDNPALKELNELFRPCSIVDTAWAPLYADLIQAPRELVARAEQQCDRREFVWARTHKKLKPWLEASTVISTGRV